MLGQELKRLREGGFCPFASQGPVDDFLARAKRAISLTAARVMTRVEFLQYGEYCVGQARESMAAVQRAVPSFCAPVGASRSDAEIISRAVRSFHDSLQRSGLPQGPQSRQMAQSPAVPRPTASLGGDFDGSAATPAPKAWPQAPRVIGPSSS